MSYFLQFHFKGGAGLSWVQLTTVEIYNIASDTWRTSATAVVDPLTKFFNHVHTGDYYAFSGSLVYRFDEGAETFDTLTNLVVEPGYAMQWSRFGIAVPGAQLDCRPL